MAMASPSFNDSLKSVRQWMPANFRAFAMFAATLFNAPPTPSVARLLATYHPAYLLRNPAAKGEVWSGLKKVMNVLGLKPKRP